MYVGSTKSMDTLLAIQKPSMDTLLAIQKPLMDWIILGFDPSFSQTTHTIGPVFIPESNPQPTYLVVHVNNTTKVGYEGNQNRNNFGFKRSVNDPMQNTKKKHSKN